MKVKAKTRRAARPFVFINVAITADGKIATANRAVHSFGSARDLRNLYTLRATADAILCGARTVEISQATLGNGGERFRRLRLANGLAEYPLRVIVSGAGTIDPKAKIFQKRFSPILLLTTQRISAEKLAQLRPLVDEIKMCGEDGVDFATALNWLRKKWRIKRLLCEGGGELNDALFRANLVDEVHATICPKIFGGREAPTMADGLGALSLKQASPLKITSKKALKGELFTVFSVMKNGKL